MQTISVLNWFSNRPLTVMKTITDCINLYLPVSKTETPNELEDDKRMTRAILAVDFVRMT